MEYFFFWLDSFYIKKTFFGVSMDGGEGLDPFYIKKVGICAMLWSCCWIVVLGEIDQFDYKGLYYVRGGYCTCLLPFG